MKIITGKAALAAVLFLAVAPAARPDTATEVYQAIGIKVGAVLTSSVLAARVLPGEAKQVVAITTYFTGKKDEAAAVNVRLDVFRREGDALVGIYSRDFGRENGGFVGRGEVQLVDMDGDGANEIIAGFDDLRNPLIQIRHGEVIVSEDTGFRVAWSGELEYDATRAARDVSQDRRDRFTRKPDLPATLRTRGITLFMTKTVYAVAGERLAAPKIVQETFPLGEPPQER